MVLVNWGKVADLAICNDQLVRANSPTTSPSPSCSHQKSLPGSGPTPYQLYHVLQIGVAFSQSNVSSYVVDLTRVTRTGTVTQDPVQASQPQTQQTPNPGVSLRRIYERPSTTCSKPQRWVLMAPAGCVSQEGS